MLIDMQDLLLDPTYEFWAPEAVFTDKSGVQRSLKYLDHRDGTNINAARGYRGSTSILPAGFNSEDAAILFRQSDVPTAPSGWTVTLPHAGGTKTYKIASALQKGVPGSGEWACKLVEA
ncbi:hypothetical protein ACQZ46_23740 [Agrobacterium salinitolerans]